MNIAHTLGECKTSCPDGTYTGSCTDPVDNVTVVACCLPCEATCNTCANASVCIDCPASEFIQPITNLCGATCADGYYENTNICSSCTNNCLTCTSTSATCSNCVTNYALSGTSCVADSACPDRYFFELVTGTPD